MQATPAATWVSYRALSGFGVALEPLTAHHADALAAAGEAHGLSETRITWVPDAHSAQAYCAKATEMLAAGTRFPWVVRVLASNEIVGSTSFHDVIADTRRLEIGHTFYAKAWQRSFVNTACKTLLLSHAFEAMDANVVGLRTDALNTQSQQAILRLGAKLEGTLRSQALRRDGSIRDTMIFSISREEWFAGVKERLTQRMSQ
jgi:N-acetyltransferase